jgi:peptidoglycan hydrolase-like protein with peptidoglycan-binding domain
MRKLLIVILLGAMLFAGVAPLNLAAAGQTKQGRMKKVSATVQTPARSSSTGKSRSRRRVSHKSNRGQKNPEPDRITEIQEALVREGAFSGTPTGKLDPATVVAIRKFQASNGLNPTGKLDAVSLQKLGLGSEIAGMAAPLAAEAGPSQGTHSN